MYTNRRADSLYKIYSGSKPIPTMDSAKYLGMHLNSRLTWETHVKMKEKQIKKKLNQLYWLMGRHTPLDISCKRLLYIQIVEPIWTYGLQLWGCAKPSNRDLIQAKQSIILRIITDAYRYSRNADIHNDLKMKFVEDVIRDYAKAHEKRLHQHTNVEAIQLLDTEQDIRRLKRNKPQDLTL